MTKPNIAFTVSKIWFPEKNCRQRLNKFAPKSIFPKIERLLSPPTPHAPFFRISSLHTRQILVSRRRTGGGQTGLSNAPLVCVRTYMGFPAAAASSTLRVCPSPSSLLCTHPIHTHKSFFPFLSSFLPSFLPVCSRVPFQLLLMPLMVVVEEEVASLFGRRRVPTKP